MEATSVSSIPIEGEKDTTFSATPSSTKLTGIDQESLDRNLSSGTKNISNASGMTSTVNENPKISMMAKAKLNFVIPKNKLSGGLVPVTRNNSKRDPTETMKEEALKKIPSRKTKWGPDLSQDIHVRRGRSLALQTRVEQLVAQLDSGNLDIDNNDATCSPPPPRLYDALGHRMNIREGQRQEQLDFERRIAIEECMKLNPSYKPPSGFKPVPKEAKLYIPTKDYPGYNFVSLILGPLGNTQKWMEAETGTKITVQGKGAVKEGKLSSWNGKDMDDALEDLHVHISADTFEKVDAAVAMVEPLLRPINDCNIQKMKQLRELVEMNGTLRNSTRSGEAGHREWQRPEDELQTFHAKVICLLCGDGGHPTFDCPLKVIGQGNLIDKEYLNFLEELGTGLRNGGKTSATDVSQPMLLTASGARPMPPRWMTSENMTKDLGEGGIPKFPFCIPGETQDMNACNLFPRFFHGLFRGRPIPEPGFPMMAGMLSAFRERFPFPPGLRPDIRLPFPTEGLASSLQTEVFTGQQPLQAGEIRLQEREIQDTSTVSLMATSPFPLASFTSANMPFHSSAGGSPLVYTSSQTTSILSVKNPSPTERPPQSHVTIPLRPPVRFALPSVRPAALLPLQGSSFTQLAGERQDNVSSNGRINILNNSTNNFSQPSPSWPGVSNLGAGQTQSSLHRERASMSMGYTPLTTLNMYTGPESGSFLLKPWATNPPAALLQLSSSSTADMNPSMPALIAPVQVSQITRIVPSLNVPPVQPQSFRPTIPPSPQGRQSLVHSHQQSSYSKPNFRFPLSGQNAQVPAVPYMPFSSSINQHQISDPQQGYSYLPQEAVRAQNYPHMGAFSLGFHNIRLPQDTGFAVHHQFRPQQEAVFVSTHNVPPPQEVGFPASPCIWKLQEAGYPAASHMRTPQETSFPSPYLGFSLDSCMPSHVMHPVPALQRIGGSMEHLSVNSNRSDVRRQSEGNTDKKLWGDKSNAEIVNTPEVDPEYEKLMASVGVL